MMWRERIQAARECGHFTLRDLLDAGCCVENYEATGFSLCAVGEQADRYGAALFFLCPDVRAGVLDEQMRTMGGSFAGAVSVHQFNRAETLLDRIEDRALQLKRKASS